MVLPAYYFLIYVAIINIYGFAIMGIDKWKSKGKGRRIPEKHLFAIAILLGSAGVYLGMRVFHHKTLHNKFRFGIPCILIADIIVAAYMFMKQ